MYCKKCGTENSDKTKFCKNCGFPINVDHSNKKKKVNGCLVAFAIVDIIITVVFALCYFVNDNNDKKPTNGVSALVSEWERKDEIKAACKEIPYKDIARNPEQYVGEYIIFTGEIIQVEESYTDNHYYARVNVTETDYGYDDTIYLTFELQEGDSKFLENDIIKIYGICNGEESYMSVLGEKITIPSIEGIIVDLVK